MKSSFKMASLAALTAATLALPVAAADMQDAQAKCQAMAGMTKCGPKCVAKCAAKCGPKKHSKAKAGAKKCAPKCAPKCGAKCAPKCAPKK
jgi:hypothetical protein